MIDSHQAPEALNANEHAVRRGQRSQVYLVAGLVLLIWAVMPFADDVLMWFWPRYGAYYWNSWFVVNDGLYFWFALYVVSALGLVVLGAYHLSRNGIRLFDRRTLLALLLIAAFGLVCCTFGRFSPRQQTVFWEVYITLVYLTAGLRFGYAFAPLGATIIALTLIGYFYIPGVPLLPWMAAVNGGALIAGTLWMRRG
ncbi:MULTISPECIES: hypothetical protein [unclassified Bradyrhizobium]|uniref:hypothetical protein n=1 Tax=unclassified Bradyrhizobium TaxID=2631580 RepID=UPI0015C88023|nr:MULTISPECIES: hypothetical protein [unclassified Bradyrhizobium]MBB4261734.1 hypothetical protein [Bradyrhizobium sp. CIR3A]NYG43842.1 hypothetical protein [Bradyrhizobium sp. IAR9]